VEPVNGNPDNGGSASALWRSLQEVLDKGLVETRAWESLGIAIKGNPHTVAYHSLIVKNPAKLFVDAPAHDLHLRKDARAVDAGGPDLAPDIDRDKVSRPWGDGCDIGAYEYHGVKLALNRRKRKNPKPERTRQSKKTLRQCSINRHPRTLKQTARSS